MSLDIIYVDYDYSAVWAVAIDPIMLTITSSRTYIVLIQRDDTSKLWSKTKNSNRNSKENPRQAIAIYNNIVDLEHELGMNYGIVICPRMNAWIMIWDMRGARFVKSN